MSKTGQVLKVTYPYSDKAVVTKSLDGQSTVDFFMLQGDYAEHAPTLIQSCSDDTTTDVGSLWYHFEPSLGACQTLIQTETSSIQSDGVQARLEPERRRPGRGNPMVLPVTAKLGPANLPSQDFYPEYDRLFGI